ncbi:MAG: cytochrome c oxidase subunit II [Nitrospinota bacterium]|nr:cytochrome c oxidase subunit II [Nitrospinota bacterium]
MSSISLVRGIGLAMLFASPASASGGGGEIPNPASDWDHLWNHVLMDLFVLGGIFAAAAIYMVFKYRAKSPEDVGTPVKLTTAQMWGWALIPAFIFMADDFYLAAKGWTVWNTYRRVPANALEVKVTGSMWSWEFEYENGATSDVLTVPVGRPVVLRMISDDVVHSFFLPKYRVKEDLMPGRVTYLWFNPTEIAKTYATCTEFCGAQHAEMNAEVNVVSENEFNAWLDNMAETGTAKAAPGILPVSANMPDRT